MIKKNLFIIVFFFLLIYFFWTRTYLLNSYPEISVEEAGTFFLFTEYLGHTDYGMIGETVYETDYSKGMRFFSLPIIDVFFKLFGIRLFSIRLLNVTLNFLNILIVFFISKLYFGKKIALITIIFLEVLPLNIFYTRTILRFRDITLFYSIISIALFLLYYKNRHRKYLLILSILLFFIACYNHPIGIHIFVSIFSLIVLHYFLTYRKYVFNIFKNKKIILVLLFIVIVLILLFKDTMVFTVRLPDFERQYSESKITFFINIISAVFRRFYYQTTFVIDMLSARNGYRWFVGNIFKYNYIKYLIYLNLLFFIFIIIKFKNIFLFYLFLLGLIYVYLPVFSGVHESYYGYFFHNSERYFVFLAFIYTLIISYSIHIISKSKDYLLKYFTYIFFLFNILYYIISFNYFYFYVPFNKGNQFYTTFEYPIFSRRIPTNEYGTFEYLIGHNNQSLFQNIIDIIDNDKINDSYNKILLVYGYIEYSMLYKIYSNEMNDIYLTRLSKMHLVDGHKVNVPEYFDDDFVRNNSHYLYILEFTENTFVYWDYWKVREFNQHNLNITEKVLLKEIFDKKNIHRYNIWRYKIEK